MGRNSALVLPIESGRRRPEKTEVVEEQWIKQPVCMICNKTCLGFYGRWGNVGTCSKAHEKIQAEKPRYPRE